MQKENFQFTYTDYTSFFTKGKVNLFKKTKIKESFNFEELLTILLSIIVCICPLLIFNWLCFKKITLWIEKPTEDHFK